MPAGQIVCSSGEVYEKRRSIIRDELCTSSSILVLKKRVPSLPKRVTIRKEMTDIPTDQLIDRNSQDSRRRGIRVQTIALVINDHDSVEYILEDG